MSSVKPISSISVITVISFKYFIDHFSIFYSPNELILNVLIDHHTSYLQCHVDQLGGLPRSLCDRRTVILVMSKHMGL